MSLTKPVKKRALYYSSLKTAKAMHLHWVYNDPDFITSVEELNPPPKPTYGADKKWKKPYEALESQYCLGPGDVIRFKLQGYRGILIGSGLTGYGWVWYNKKNDSIELAVNKKITKKEFISLWGRIKTIQTNELRIKPNKRKPPENSQLIYAVFKARKRQITFKKIFKMYQEGTLDYYSSKSSSQFKSEDLLERYYDRYRPDKSRTLKESL